MSSVVDEYESVCTIDLELGDACAIDLLEFFHQRHSLNIAELNDILVASTKLFDTTLDVDGILLDIGKVCESRATLSFAQLSVVAVENNDPLGVLIDEVSISVRSDWHRVFPSVEKLYYYK